MVVKRQNMVKLGKIALVMSQNKPNKCKKCGNKQVSSIFIKTNMGTIGTVQYCTNCHVHIVTGVKWQQHVKNPQIVVRMAKNMVKEA